MGQKTAEKSANSTLICPEKWQDVNELAEHLGVKVSWIYKHMSRLPHRNVGKYRRFCRPVVEEWLAEEQKEVEANR